METVLRVLTLILSWGKRIYNGTARFHDNTYTRALERPTVICIAWIAQGSVHCFSSVQV
jgi:hypothetical protein